MILAICIIAAILFIAATVHAILSKNVWGALVAAGLFFLVLGVRILPLAGVVPPPGS